MSTAGVTGDLVDRLVGGQELTSRVDHAQDQQLVPYAGIVVLIEQVDLQVGFAERHSRRTAVDDAAQGPAMAFAKAGYGKEFSVAVS